jgi:hypothetical protein
MGLLVIAALIVLLSLLISSATCLLIGHFQNEPRVKRCGIWLLCASPLSPLIVVLVIYAIISIREFISQGL